MTRNLSSSFAGNGSLELVPVAGEYISFDAFLIDVVFFTVVGCGFAVAELFVIVDAHDFDVIGVAVFSGCGAALIGLGAALTPRPASLVGVSVFLAGVAAAFVAAFTEVFAGLPADVAVDLVVGFAAGFAAGLAAGLAVGLEVARAGFATPLTGLAADLAGFAADAAFFAGAFATAFDDLAAAVPATFFAGTELFEPAPFAGALFFDALAGTVAFFEATALAGFAACFDAAGFFAADFVLFAAVFFVFFAAIIVIGFRDSEKMIEIIRLLPFAPVQCGTDGR